MEKFVNNILEIYNLASDLEKAEGMNWYSDARQICLRFSKRFNLSFELVCYVMAALSPNNKWQRNITDCERVLDLYTSGKLFNKVRDYQNGDKEALKGIACTYTANLIKAFNILENACTSYLGNGLKTRNFALNIYIGEVTDTNVTVDYHAFSVAVGIRHTINSIKSTSFRPKQYNEISEAYRLAAEQVNIQPKQMQAITWVTWRNIDQVK